MPPGEARYPGDYSKDTRAFCSLLGKAVYYTLGQWQKLITFLTQGEVPLDNNRCENAIRPFVVGRKGWMFSDTVKGAVASANLFSIVETAKANGVEPHAYLSLLFAQLPYAKTVEDFETLLPWNVKTALAQDYSTYRTQLIR